MNGVALITGAAQRIGQTLAENLAADGWAVGVHYARSADAALALGLGLMIVYMTLGILNPAGVASQKPPSALVAAAALVDSPARAASAAPGPTRSAAAAAAFFRRKSLALARTNGLPPAPWHPGAAGLRLEAFPKPRSDAPSDCSVRVETYARVSTLRPSMHRRRFLFRPQRV